MAAIPVRNRMDSAIIFERESLIVVKLSSFLVVIYRGEIVNVMRLCIVGINGGGLTDCESASVSLRFQLLRLEKSSERNILSSLSPREDVNFNSKVLLLLVIVIRKITFDYRRRRRPK